MTENLFTDSNVKAEITQGCCLFSECSEVIKAPSAVENTEAVINQCETDEDDIVEYPEMTIEAEEMIEYFMTDIPKDALKIIIPTDGGLKIFHNKFFLEISGDGTISGIVFGSEVIYKDFQKEELRNKIREIFGLEKFNIIDSSAENVSAVTTEVLDESVDDELDDIPETNQPLIIKLCKGLNKIQIHKFIEDVSIRLSNERFTSIKIITEDWDKDQRHFALIPGAKKLFARYIDEGLLALLVFGSYLDAAQDLYNVAYGKGKSTERGIEFKAINKEEFTRKIFSTIGK